MVVSVVDIVIEGCVGRLFEQNDQLNVQFIP